MNALGLTVIMAPMKKIILTGVGLLAVITAAGSASSDVLSAVDAELNRLSASPKPEARLETSMSSMQSTAEALLTENAGLQREYKDLLSQVVAAEAAVDVQRKKNADQLAALEARRRELESPSVTGELRQKIAAVEKDTASERGMLNAAQARLQAADSKTALLKLRVQELEIEKKSLLLERRERSSSTLNVLKQSIRSLKAQVDSQKKQVEYVNKKISELMSIDRPYVKDVRQQIAETARLKAELDKIIIQRNELQRLIDAEAEKRDKFLSAPEQKPLQEKLQSKQQLTERVAAAMKLRKDLVEQAKVQEVSASEVADQVKKQEESNKELEDALANLRENIAVLEYKVNTIARYNNRNQLKK